MFLGLLLVALACSVTRTIGHEDVGPWVKATKGELFPRASVRSVDEDFFIVRPSTFQFRIVGNTCDIVEDAMDRYISIMLTDARIALKAALPLTETCVRSSSMSRGELVSLDINLINPCERYPYLGMNENYTLVIDMDTNSRVLKANDVWGILRGLESFSQLLAASSDGHLTIKLQEIHDSPRFPHRGLLLDTSRHYFPVSDILLTLDAMSYNKLNVFHWHIVDDNSFPYVSTTYPKFSEKGAYHPTMVYKPSDVRKIIEYARLRGIRVIPEFDTPAHTKSWSLAYPEMLTECYENGKPNGKLGPINPVKYNEILQDLFAEVFRVFPDRSVHLGGDEISFDCWATNPDLIEFLHDHGWSNDIKNLEMYYFARLLAIPAAQNITSIVWQEVYQNVDNLPTDTVVQIWTGSWQGLTREVVSKNYSTILSACWYLDSLQSGGDWTKYYMCDPTNFDGTPAMKSRVLGGEACMWGEFVDRTNVHQRIWPRASAAAERLWSNDKESTDKVAKRLEEHSCRMNRRGIPAQPPNGAGYCVL